MYIDIDIIWFIMLFIFSSVSLVLNIYLLISSFKIESELKAVLGK